MTGIDENKLPARERLIQALQQALDRYEFVMGQRFPADVILTPLNTDEFVALIRPNGDGVEIVVSSGVVSTIDNLWHAAMALSDTLPEENRFNVGHVDDAIDHSLSWLMLHELSHAAGGHLKLVGSRGVSETIQCAEVGLTGRSGSKPSALRRLDEKTAKIVQRCLELQADHDALEIMIDEYTNQDWDYVRFYTACAMAVLVLIDEHDQADDASRTHPKAATRTFQMFGVLATLWDSPRASKTRVAGAEEISAFYHSVVAPSISDYSILAHAIRAKAIVYSQQELDVLFRDIRTMRMPEDRRVNPLVTEPAKEYQELVVANEIANELLGPK